MHVAVDIFVILHLEHAEQSPPSLFPPNNDGLQNFSSSFAPLIYTQLAFKEGKVFALLK